MTFFDDKKSTGSSSTQSSDIANMDDFKGLDTSSAQSRKEVQGFSYAKGAIVGAVMLATGSAEAMFDEEWQEQTPVMSAYTLLSRSLNYGYDTDKKSELDKLRQIQASLKEREALKADIKVLVDKNGNIENPQVFLKEAIKNSTGYEQNEVSNFEKYLKNISLIFQNEESSYDFSLILSSALDALLQRDFR